MDRLRAHHSDSDAHKKTTWGLLLERARTFFSRGATPLPDHLSPEQPAQSESTPEWIRQREERIRKSEATEAALTRILSELRVSPTDALDILGYDRLPRLTPADLIGRPVVLNKTAIEVQTVQPADVLACNIPLQTKDSLEGIARLEDEMNADTFDWNRVATSNGEESKWLGTGFCKTK